jgi:hypothetical protein
VSYLRSHTHSRVPPAREPCDERHRRRPPQGDYHGPRHGRESHRLVPGRSKGGVIPSASGSVEVSPAARPDRRRRVREGPDRPTSTARGMCGSPVTRNRHRLARRRHSHRWDGSFVRQRGGQPGGWVRSSRPRPPPPDGWVRSSRSGLRPPRPGGWVRSSRSRPRRRRPARPRSAPRPSPTSRPTRRRHHGRTPAPRPPPAGRRPPVRRRPHPGREPGRRRRPGREPTPLPTPRRPAGRRPDPAGACAAPRRSGTAPAGTSPDACGSSPAPPDRRTPAAP